MKKKTVKSKSRQAKVIASWQDESIREARTLGTLNSWKDEDVRRRRSENIRLAWASGKYANRPKSGGRPKGSKRTKYNLTPEGLERQREAMRETLAYCKANGIKLGRPKGLMFTPEQKAKVSRGVRQAIAEGRVDPAENMRRFLKNGASEAYLNRGTSRSECGYFESPKSGRIFYGSSWELERFRILDKSPSIKSFIRANGINLPYVVNGEQHRYYPDFIVEYVDGTRVLEEVKNPYNYSLEETKQKVKVAKAYCQKNGLNYRILHDYESLAQV